MTIALYLIRHSFNKGLMASSVCSIEIFINILDVVKSTQGPASYNMLNEQINKVSTAI
jgi:hypothetical protein